jgi:diguanylate cyclase (GGDEF)-like protein
MFGRAVVHSISLDVSTLFVVAISVSALLGLFLLYAWTQERTRALAWWGSAYLIGAVSVLLWSLDGVSAPAVLPTALLLLACGLFWSAARIFHGRKVLWAAAGAGALVWLLACVAMNFVGVGGGHIAFASLIVSVYTFLTALELRRERRDAPSARWRAMFFSALHGAVFLLPIPLASVSPDDSILLTFAGGWTEVFILEVLLYAVASAFMVLVLAKNRTLRMHKTAALTDPLTGLFNRRGLAEVTRELAEKQAWHSHPVTVLVFDLDHFKSVNDRFGHTVGDETLKLFASIASSSMRLTDFVARLGGEEFAAIIPGTIEEGLAVAERVRAAFETAARTVAGRPVGATVSVGVATDASAPGIDALIALADGALYAAKAGGRNRVEAAQPSAPEQTPMPTAAEAAEGVALAKSIHLAGYRRARGASAERQAAA